MACQTVQNYFFPDFEEISRISILDENENEKKKRIMNVELTLF